MTNFNWSYFSLQVCFKPFLNEYTTTSDHNVGLVPVSLTVIDPSQRPILAVPLGGQYSLKQTRTDRLCSLN